MKNFLRYLTFPVFLLIMLLGSSLSLSSQATPLDRDIDPACLQFCQQQHYDCFLAAGGSHGAERHCLGEYRHCIAQCGKH